MHKQINPKIALSIILLLSVIASIYIVSRAQDATPNVTARKLACATVSSAMDGVTVPEGEYGDDVGSSRIGGTLSVERSSNLGFNFSLDVINYQTNIGQIEGVACVTEKENIFLFDDEIISHKEQSSCQIIFQYNAETRGIKVETSSACDSYGGRNVTFDSTYVKDRLPEKPSANEIDILKNESERKIFTDLVGDIDLYDFLAVMDDDVSTYTLGGNIRVREVSSYVFARNSLIALDEVGNMWVLVKEYQGKPSRESMIRYFTNVTKDKNKIPEWLIFDTEFNFCDRKYSDVEYGTVPMDIMFDSEQGKPIRTDITSEICIF